MTVGINTVNATIQTSMRWQTEITIPGGLYQPLTNANNINKSYTITTSSANAASGGGDEVFSFQQAISAGSSATINLAAMTDIMQRSSTTLVRIKAMQIRLLSAADDSSISPAPTATSTITVTNNGVATPSPLDFATGGTGATVTLTVSSGAVTAVAVGAAGSGYPPSSVLLGTPQQASASGCVIIVETDSSGTVTSVDTTSADGTGYSAATVPLVIVGQYTIATGGCHTYFDPIAAGFLAVSSTSNRFKIINNDADNDVTVELSFYGAST